MRKTVFLLASLFVMVLATQRVNAQNSATGTANATATIVTGISISNSTDLAFGEIVPSSTDAGTVTVATDGTRTYSNVFLYTQGTNTFNAATFTVTGTADATYTITLPTSSVPITHTDGATTMYVDNFTSDPSGTGTLSGGTQTLSVGATLNVGANQTAGYYTGTFDVTVTYN